MTPKDILLEAYRRMLRIRGAEERIAEDFRNRKIFSFYHSSIGQEANAVGVCQQLETADRVYGNHRSHGHYLAKGGNLTAMLAEIYGKTSGCCKGFGGSMHMLDRSVGFMGSTPILGSVVPIAVGSAFEQKFAGSRNITVCFFGDGASEEGVVYESINLAAIHKLPVLFVLEDNLYAVNSTAATRRSKVFSYRNVVEGLGCRYLDADGGSFEEVYSQARMLVNQLRNGRGPAMLSVHAYRHMAHSGPIKDESVRHKCLDTEDARKADDPVINLANKLQQHYPASKADIETEIATELDSAFKEILC